MDERNRGDTESELARAKRVQVVIEDVLRRRRAGEPTATDEAVLAAHPDLLLELTAALAQLRLIQQAFQAADQSGDSRSARGGLHIRCPHCHNPIEVVERDSLSSVTCPTCGSNFSLITGHTTQSHHGKAHRVAHFELVDQVGQGAFGVVWKARDTVLQRTVALKIPRHGQFTPEEAEYFFRDARAAAQLTHPGIVSVYEVGREGNTLYIASEFIEGATLAEWIEAHPLTAREAAELLVQVAEAIQHAHERGVVHRDLKPGNILLDIQGVPHVADFGLAKRDAGEITVTIDGQVLGTPAYMSPEQARGHGHQADARSDVYSLGVILFELLTGELPFRGSKAMLVVQILKDEPPSLRKLSGSVPRDLETICLKAMAKEPGRRYATAKDLAADLKQYVEGQPILARPVGRMERTWRWCKRKPAVAALLSAVALLFVAVALFAIREFTHRAQLAETNLYHRMVRQVQVDRTSGSAGFVTRAWRDLKQARWADTPELDLDMLRQEAVACLGDFRGYKPITITPASHSITACALHPQGKYLAIGHTDGRIELYDPSSGKPILTIKPLGKFVKALSFTESGDRLLSVDASGRVWRCAIATAIRAKEPPEAIELFHVDQGFATFGFALGGRYLVAHNKKSAVVRATENGAQIGRFDAPDDRLLVSVSLSPDEKWLAASYSTSAGTGQDQLMMWNFATGELEKDVPLHRGRGYERALAFSHNSKLLAFGGEGLALRRMPMLDQYFQYPGDAIVAVAFSPDNQLLALVQIRGSVTLRSMATNQRIASLPHPHRGDDQGESVTFSADGRFLVSAKMGSVHIWNLQGGDGRIVLPGHDDGVQTLSFSSDGLRLASGGKDQTARIWNVRAGTLAQPPLPLPGKVQCLAFSPTGLWLATANWTTGDASIPNLHIWNTRDFSKPIAIPHQLGADVHCVAFSPDGHYLAACGNGMSLWRVEEAVSADGEVTLTHVKHLLGKMSLFAQFSPKSNLLAWADDWENLRIWDIARKSDITLDRKMHQGWHGLAFVGNEDLAFVTTNGTLEVWNARDNRLEFKLGEPGEFQSPHIAATADGAYVAGVSAPESVSFWDVRAQKKLFVLRPERSDVWSLAFDRNGTQLAVGLSDGGVAVWDLRFIDNELALLDLSWTGDDRGRNQE